MHSLNQTYPKVCLTRVKCWLRLLSGWLRIAWHRQVNLVPNTPFAQVQIEVVAKEARCPALPPIKQKIETRSSPGKPRDHTPAGGVDEHQRPHVRSLDRARLFTYVQVDEGSAVASDHLRCRCRCRCCRAKSPGKLRIGGRARGAAAAAIILG
jgi:hypothetical protein